MSAQPEKRAVILSTPILPGTVTVRAIDMPLRHCAAICGPKHQTLAENLRVAACAAILQMRQPAKKIAAPEKISSRKVLSLVFEALRRSRVDKARQRRRDPQGRRWPAEPRPGKAARSPCQDTGSGRTRA